MWDSHGRANGLLVEPNELQRYKDRAQLFANKRHFQVESGQIPQPRWLRRLPPPTGQHLS